MRISGGKNPLDATSVHPESYEAASALLSKLDISQMIQVKSPLDFPVKTIAMAAELGMQITLRDIVANWRNRPDPR